MYISREKQLSELNKQYESGKFELALIYGRRRTGKTRIAVEFIQGKKAIYFTGSEINSKGNLVQLSRAITEYDKRQRGSITFRSFRAALEHIFDMAKKERLILVIDGYQYVSRSSKGFSDDLAMLINKYRDKTKLMVIICGSSIPYIQKNVLSLSSPLSGQITCLIKTERLNFSQTLAWFDGFSDMEKILLYGVTGGVLGYMDRINHDASACENIRKLFFYPSSALLEEPENMIRQEVREPALYNAILAATASGACRMKDISSKVGEETGVCDTYLKNLISMEFIRRETPFGEKASRKTMYTVSDNMFRFWYRFVAPNRSLIARGLKDEEFESMLPGFDKYAGEIFQEICKQYMEKMVFPEGNRGEAGRWWGTDQETGVQSEIDIMSRSDDNTLLIGVCLWAGEKVGADQLEMIKWQSRLFPEKDNEIYIFARSGFTEGCLEYAAESGNINLLTFEDVIAGLA